MTAEPDLPINDAVPAPTKIEPGNLFLWNWRQMQVYAQACVAHAVAPLQAEIEALRAEVATWEGLHASEVQVRQRWQARAELLAEALEEIRSRSSINLAMHPDPSALTARLGDIYQIADATLSKENSND